MVTKSFTGGFQGRTRNRRDWSCFCVVNGVALRTLHGIFFEVLAHGIRNVAFQIVLFLLEFGGKARFFLQLPEAEEHGLRCMDVGLLQTLCPGSGEPQPVEGQGQGARTPESQPFLESQTQIPAGILEVSKEFHDFTFGIRGKITGRQGSQQGIEQLPDQKIPVPVEFRDCLFIKLQNLDEILGNIRYQPG